MDREKLWKALELLKVPVATSLIVSSLISGAVGLHFSKRLQIDGVKNERVIAFSGGGDQFYLIAGQYIATVKANGDVSGLQTQFRTEIVKQLREAEELRHIFGDSVVAIISYEQALQNFASSLSSANSALAMRSWAEAFGQVHDARSELTRSLKQKVGVSS